MTENTNKDITVLMAGNPDAQSGESVLLNINQSPLKSEELGKIFYDYITSDYYIELKHGAEYITYTYVMNPAKVHSQGANRPGVFWIGVTIPREEQIRNPYDLIIELRDKFQKLYMTQRSDGSYEFHNVPYDVNGFKTIVDKYELVDLQSTYVQMTGEKIQTLSLNSDDGNDSAETKIRHFFDDTQYLELKEYSSVIVAEGIEGVTSIPIKVPRLIEYSVRYYDGNTYEEIKNISRKTSKFEHTLTKLYYKDINVIFSLDDVVSANNNTLQKEDNGSKYKVEKKNETITISVDRWVPKEKQVGVIIKDQDKSKWENYFNSIELTVNKLEKVISYDKDFGYYITLIGEEIGGEIKVAQKNTNDIYNYVKISQSNDSIIEIEVIEFNKIILSRVPCDEEDKKLELEINDKEEPVRIKIGTTYNGGMYDIKIADHDVLKNITQFDIKSYRYVSNERYTDKCEIEPTQYDNTKGVLGINLKGFKKVSDNKQTDGNIPNQQTGSDEPTTDDKYTFKVYNEIKESTITLNKLCVNDKGKNLLENSLGITNTTGYNGNNPKNYEEIKDIEKQKNFSIEFELKLEKSNDKNSKNDNYSKNKKANKSKDQKKIVVDIEKEKNIINFRIKEVVIDKGKKNTKEENNNYRRIDAQQNGDTYTVTYSVSIEKEANNKDNKNNILAKFKDKDILSKILKRKDDETENSKPEVEVVNNEDGDNANVDKHKNSKLRFVFRCLLFWLISLIIAFVFGLIVENQRDVLPLKNIFKNNTRSEKSGGRFGCSRKAAEEKEKFAVQISEYLILLQNCDEKLTFDMVTYIKQYCDSINNPADPRNNYISDAEEYPFNKLNNHIAVFSDVANKITKKTFTELSKVNLSDDIYKELKKNITPLLPCNDENDEACKKYTTFVSLIKDGKIDISERKSFAGVLKLYSDSESIINGKIENDKQLADQKLKKDALIGECNNYYALMEKCDKDFTFEKVNEIYNWVNDTTNKHLIEGNDKFIKIKEFIPHYKAAADAIKNINSNWTTSDWFLSENSIVLYDCFMEHTQYKNGGFNNSFRACIVHLLGGKDGTGQVNREGEDGESFHKSEDFNKEFFEYINSYSNEINHTETYSANKKYLKVDEGLYGEIKNVLKNAQSIKSFRDLKTIGKQNNK